ncbi:MAG TPA: NepR family anti-sigma factor [Phenylobacterium sp.]
MPRTSKAKVEAVSAQLREMFQALEMRPIPDRLMSIIDQLDDGRDAPPRARLVANQRVTSG